MILLVTLKLINKNLPIDIIVFLSLEIYKMKNQNY